MPRVIIFPVVLFVMIFCFMMIYNHLAAGQRKEVAKTLTESLLTALGVAGVIAVILYVISTLFN